MTRVRKGGPLVAGIVCLSVLLLAGCTAPTDDTAPEETPTILSSSRIEPALAELPERSVVPLPSMRLAEGLAPPTNRWFSGLVFGDAPQPVFPLPLSFALTESGFAFGLPSVTSGADTIASGFTPDVSVDAGGASAQISGYDDASVTIDRLDGQGRVLGSLVIAEGSPLVSYTARAESTLKLPPGFAADSSAGDDVWSAKLGASNYGLSTEGRVSGSTLSLQSGQSAVWFAIPPGGDLGQLADRVSPLRAVSSSYRVADSTVTTTLRYRSAGATLIATLPHQTLPDQTQPHQGQESGAAAECGLGSYESIYGMMTLCLGDELTWSAQRIRPSGSLDLRSLTAEQRELLREQLLADTRARSALPVDSYFGGKALYRLANLLDLAEQLGEKEAAGTLRQQLGSALRRWADPTGCEKREAECFVYDEKARSVVGLEASFGSDQLNDHHFHYGYLLYAASVAGGYDATLRDDIAPMIDLVAADIASSDGGLFPERRVFDAYAGHSWASGFSPFADGNNQESSSEAVTAWNGLALWAQQRGDPELERQATWMLSSEAASANAYWTDFDEAEPVYGGYQHSIVSLNWGAKRDYATWFSPEPNAKLGILTLPMSPVAGYLGGDPARIARNLREALPSGYTVQFSDYLLMYAALGGEAEARAALAEARRLPEKLIDDGNSRSYLLAWILSR